jgi:hypothetical protein
MAISKFNYNSFNVTPVAGNALSFNSDADGFTTQGASSMILIKTLTASSSANLTFVNGTSDVVLDNTYPVYLFKFINMHPASNGAFQVNFRDGSTAYDATKTSSGFQAYHREDGSASLLGYADSLDVAQDTGEQMIAGGSVVNNNDSGVSGELFLFNPSSTTFVKHYMTVANSFDTSSPPYSSNQFSAGYCNTTTAIDGVRFQFGSGNTDSGTIKLYGIKDS